MTNEIWRREKVLSVIGLRPSWLYWAMKRDLFPHPIKLGIRAVGWRSEEVLDWVKARQSKAQ